MLGKKIRRLWLIGVITLSVCLLSAAETFASEKPLIAVPVSNAGYHISLGDITDSRTTGKFFKYLRIEIKLDGGGLRTVFGVSKPVITAAVDDVGDSLVNAKKNKYPLFWTMEKNKDKKSSIEHQLDLVNPARRATSFSVAGYIDVLDPAGDRASIHTIKKFLKYAGKPSLSASLAKTGLTIAVLTKPLAEKMKQRRMQEEKTREAAGHQSPERAMKNAFVNAFKGFFSGFFMMGDNDLLFVIKDPKKRLAYVEVDDASGNPIKTQGHSLGQGTGTYRYTLSFEKPVPANAQLKIYLATAKSLKRIPFRIESQPLP